MADAPDGVMLRFDGYEDTATIPRERVKRYHPKSKGESPEERTWPPTPRDETRSPVDEARDGVRVA